jgi:hypothetical protein
MLSFVFISKYIPCIGAKPRFTSHTDLLKYLVKRKRREWVYHQATQPRKIIFTINLNQTDYTCI